MLKPTYAPPPLKEVMTAEDQTGTRAQSARADKAPLGDCRACRSAKRDVSHKQVCSSVFVNYFSLHLLLVVLVFRNLTVKANAVFVELYWIIPVVLFGMTGAEAEAIWVVVTLGSSIRIVLEHGPSNSKSAYPASPASRSSLVGAANWYATTTGKCEV